MRQMTLRQQTVLALSVGFALTQVLTAVLFTRFSYTLIERDLRRYLISESTELVREQFIIDKNGLRFALDPDGDSVTDRLRKRGLSALVVNPDGMARSVFGIYRTFISEGEDAMNVPGIKEIMTASFNGFSHLTLATREQFETYTIPLKSDNESIAFLQVAREERSLQDILGSSLLILSAFIPSSILIGVLLSLWIARRALSPLEKLIKAVERIPGGVFPDRVPETHDSSPEYHILVSAINRLLSSLSLTFVRHKEFIGNVAHELRTPLTKMMTTIDATVVGGHTISSSVKSALDSIEEDVLGMRETIDGLLSIARLYETDTGNSTECDLNSVIGQLIEEYDRAIKQRRTRFIKEIPMACTIPMPSAIAKALLGNIIGNAVKFVRDDGIVRIRAVSTSTEVRVTVADNGIGMTPDILSHMFERRFRGTKQTFGHGVGMAIVKRIADMWHVEINVESKVKKGTTVVLTMKKK